MKPLKSDLKRILLKYLRSHRRMQGLPIPKLEYGTPEPDDTWLLPDAERAILKLVEKAEQEARVWELEIIETDITHNEWFYDNDKMNATKVVEYIQERLEQLGGKTTEDRLKELRGEK